MKRITSLSLAAAMAITALGSASALAQPYQPGPPPPGYYHPPPPHPPGPPGPPMGPPPGGPGWHQWHHGDHYYGDRYVVNNWHHYGLRPPPHGYQWVQNGGQFVMIAIASGVVTFGYQDHIIDRFFLGGDNLRGFADGGVGPHDVSTGDSLGGNIMWTGSAELQFPLPVSPDLGVNGFAFVDTGSTWSLPVTFGPVFDSSAPRVGTGVGVAWNTPFGLIDLSFAEPIVKQKDDQIQQFRVSFGTRF